MDIIRSQIAAARRRLLVQRFTRIASWTLFAMLILAVVAAAVPKLWPVPVPTDLWLLGWIGGAVACGLVIATIATLLTRPSLAQTAVEVDRRFGLKERLSSTLALDDEARETEMGRALVEDASRRAKSLSIGEQFAMVPYRRSWLPLVPAVFLVVLLLVPDATRKNVADAGVDPVAREEAEQVRRAATQLKKRLEQRRREAEAKGLKDAEQLFDKLERQADRIAKRDDASKKETLIALNDLKKQLQERRDALGSPDQMRKALAPMKSLQEGPAEQTAKALAEGDFGKAKEHLEKLAQQLRDDSLSEEAKQQLAEQMRQLEESIREAGERHQQAKQQLQEQIEQAKREGRMEDAAKMQQKLDELQQMDSSMQQMQQMADQISNAREAMQNGDGEKASEALDELSEQLGEMQSEMDQLEDLQDAMDQLAQTKDQMGCKQCNGLGCPDCQGGGNSQNMGRGGGQGGLRPGTSPGRGPGEQGEEPGESNSYESQVRGEPKAGRAIIAGTAGGPNRKGDTREAVQDAVTEALAEESDPLSNQPLPKAERQHAQQYFDRLRQSNL